MVLVAEHPVRPEPHDFIIFKRELVTPKQVYQLSDFPLALASAEDAGVTRSGNRVTVKIASVAPVFSPSEFTVRRGDLVTVIMTNFDTVEDLTHGFAIEKYNINFIVNPQETKSVTFRADKAGVYWYYCTHFCHALHLEMRGRMIVEG
jgi:nitrous-oxide reductase